MPDLPELLWPLLQRAMRLRLYGTTPLAQIDLDGRKKVEQASGVALNQVEVVTGRMKPPT